jgi:hypothetical protein
VTRAVERVHAAKFITLREEMRKLHPDQWTMLPFFSVSVAEVSTEAGMQPEKVERINLLYSFMEATSLTVLLRVNMVRFTPTEVLLL